MKPRQAPRIDLEGDWHPDVYKGPEYNVEAWRRLQNQIINRDRGRCKSCRTTRNLTVHHVVPRDKGGTDATCNLVTLCACCHDYVEVGSTTSHESPTPTKPEADSNDWHTWVYGGARRP